MMSNTKICSNLFAILYILTIALSLQLFSISNRLGHESVSTYRWLNNDEIKEMFTKLKDVPEDSAKGYILEVDLEIPLRNMITLTSMFLLQNIWM